MTHRQRDRHTTQCGHAAGRLSWDRGGGGDILCVLQVTQHSHNTIPFVYILTHLLSQSIYGTNWAITKWEQRHIFHPWEFFPANTNILNAWWKIAALPSDMWTNRTEKCVDVNVELAYKACLNHSRCSVCRWKMKLIPIGKKPLFEKSHSLFINIHKTSWNTNFSCQSLIKYTLNKNLFLSRLNNIKEVMHLQHIVMCLDRTHHSQSAFSAPDKAIILISLGEKQSSAQVQQKQHRNSYNAHHIYSILPFICEWWALKRCPANLQVFHVGRMYLMKWQWRTGIYSTSTFLCGFKCFHLLGIEVETEQRQALRPWIDAGPIVIANSDPSLDASYCLTQWKTDIGLRWQEHPSKREHTLCLISSSSCSWWWLKEIMPWTLYSDLHFNPVCFGPIVFTSEQKRGKASVDLH